MFYHVMMQETCASFLPVCHHHNCSYTQGLYLAVQSLLFCKLLYTVQSTDLKVSKMKCTGLESWVLTAKFSHRGNDDYELLKFKDSQDPLTSNKKNSGPYSVFQDVLGPWKWILLSRTVEGMWPPWK